MRVSLPLRFIPILRTRLKHTHMKCALHLTAMLSCFPMKPSAFFKRKACLPFKPLLAALHRLQQEGTPAIRVRTALVTARSAPAHERAIRTLMQWNIEVDEAMFLGGLPKGEFLKEFEPDFFFDDQTGHIESAAQHVPAGHVASGISNPPPSSIPSSDA